MLDYIEVKELHGCSWIHWYIHSKDVRNSNQSIASLSERHAAREQPAILRFREREYRLHLSKSRLAGPVELHMLICLEFDVGLNVG